MTTGTHFTRKSLISLSIAFIALPLGFLGCNGGGDEEDDGGSGQNGGNTTGAAQINATAVQDSMVWVSDSVPGCKLNTGAARAASVAAAQEGIEGAGVVRQVMSVIAEAKKAGGASLAPMAVQEFAGNCGGTLNLSDVHANGVTTYTYTFNNFCSVDDSVSPPEQSKVNGTMTAREIGTPSANGPIVSSMEASANQLTLIAKGETTELTMNKATLTYGVPAAWDPGDATATNPDRVRIDQATVRFVNQNRTHKIANFSASTYESGGDNVLNISSGTYTTTTHGYLNLTTGQPIIMNENGDWVSGSLNLVGSDGNTVVVTPSSSANGVMNVALNGTALGASLDCSGASDLAEQ